MARSHTFQIIDIRATSRGGSGKAAESFNSTSWDYSFIFNNYDVLPCVSMVTLHSYDNLTSYLMDHWKEL